MGYAPHSGKGSYKVLLQQLDVGGSIVGTLSETSLCVSMPFTFLSCIACVTLLHWKAVSFLQDLTEDGDEDRDGLVGDSSVSGTPVTSKLFCETRTPSKTSAVSPLLLSPGSSPALLNPYRK